MRVARVRKRLTAGRPSAALRRSTTSSDIRSSSCATDRAVARHGDDPVALGDRLGALRERARGRRPRPLDRRQRRRRLELSASASSAKETGRGRRRLTPRLCAARRAARAPWATSSQRREPSAESSPDSAGCDRSTSASSRAGHVRRARSS